MARHHPDRKLVNYVVDGFRNGFKLGMTRHPEPNQPCENSSKVKQRPDIAQQLVDEEVAKGHILGPFTEPPMENMFYSPINIVPKPNGKHRLIHDLAYPYDGENSVNACIPEENSVVHYHYIDELIDLALSMGTSVQGVRVDIEAAFRNLGVSAEDIRFLAFTLNGKIYINTSLPFGAASSCKIFEAVATLLEWIVKYHAQRRGMSHYLDDFPLLGWSFSDAEVFKRQFIDIMEEIGMPIAHNKTIGPCVILEFLGMLLDFYNQTLGIPEQKRQKCLQFVETLISAFRTRQKVTVKTVQKTAGHLNFICQAIPAGRTFLSTLYTLVSPGGHKPRPTHHRRITKEIHDDMLMFREFLNEMNPIHQRTIPFLVRREVFNSEIQLFADSAGAADKGFGCLFGNQWASGAWTDTDLFRDGFVPNIALLELYAIVVAFEIWAPTLAAKMITLRSDSMATVHMIQKRKAEIPAAMQLLRHLTKTCMLFQIYVQARHLPGSSNRASDLLSRGRLLTFWKENPTADRHPQCLPATLWPPRWSLDEMLPRKKQKKSDS